MTTTEKGRTRPRLIKLGAGLTLAGVTLGVVDTAHAQVPVSPPLNVTAPLTGAGTASPSTIIDWDAPTTGSPPIRYVVTVDNLNTAGVVEFTTVVPAQPTMYPPTGSFALAAGQIYSVSVVSEDGATVSAPTTIQVTTPAAPPAGVAECNTAEWSPFCTVDAFIRQQYRDWQDRAPSLDELNFWRAYLQPRNQVAGGTQNVFLDNARREKDLIAGPVVRLYSAYFLRTPEYAGYTFWTDEVEANRWSMSGASEYFARSPEFIARYGALDNAEFVSLVYQNVLGRNPDSAGFAFWTRQLQAGFTRGWMMLQFSEAPSFEYQNKTLSTVVATEIWAAMLKRAPVQAEYDQVRLQLAGAVYQPTAAAINPVYLGILARNEYRLRVTIR